MKKLFYSLILTQFIILLGGFNQSHARIDTELTYNQADNQEITHSLLHNLLLVETTRHFEQAPPVTGTYNYNFIIPVMDVEEEEEEDRLESLRHLPDNHFLFAMILRAESLLGMACTKNIDQLSDTEFTYGPSPRYLVFQVFRL